MRARNRRADRPHHAGRMELEVARLDVAAGPADPALNLDPLDEGGEHLAAIGADRLGKRQHRRQRRRQRVRRRRPHRLEIEHMHRRRVEERGRHRRQAEAEAERARRGLRPLLAQVIGEDARRRLDARARDRDADAVEDELARLGDRVVADAVGGDRHDLVAEAAGDARHRLKSGRAPHIAGILEVTRAE